MLAALYTDLHDTIRTGDNPKSLPPPLCNPHATTFTFQDSFNINYTNFAGADKGVPSSNISHRLRSHIYICRE